MDEIIEEIYNAVVKQDSERKTLILVTGDHGMKDTGGHGGTTHSETHVPLVVMGIPCRSDVIAQTDIPATLAALMGLEIPADSIGKLSSGMLSGYPIDKLLYVLRYNLLQLQTKSNLCSDDIKSSTEMHYDFMKGDEHVANATKDMYEACVRKISADLLHNSNESNDSVLLVSCICIVLCFLLNFKRVFLKYDSKHFLHQSFIVLTLVFLCVFENESITSLLTLFALCLLIFHLRAVFLVSVTYKEFHVVSNYRTATIVLLSGFVLHSVSMFSSSFIEEEHQIWYYAFGTILAVMTLKNPTKDVTQTVFNVAIFTAFCFLKKLNQTGDKWANVPDLAQWFSSTNNFVHLNTFYAFSLFSVWISSRFLITNRTLSSHVMLFTLTCVYFIKMFTRNHPTLGKFVWFLIALRWFLSRDHFTNNVIVTWILISCTLLRPHNVIIITFCLVTSRSIHKTIKSDSVVTLAHVCLLNALFFCQGHGNSFASVDIASGYFGLETYRPFVVILQVISHTYSMHVLVFLLLMKSVNMNNVWGVIVTQRMLVVVTTFTSSFLHRNHLFVWSVFAPKVLIESSHSVVLLVEILLYCVSCKYKYKKYCTKYLVRISA